MSQRAYIISGNGTINLHLDKAYAIPKSHPNYSQIKEGLDLLDEEALISLADIPLAIENFVSSVSHKAEVKFGQVYFDGTPLHNTMTDRILQQIAEGFSGGPILRFLENLMNNPSMESIEESYDFLSNKGLPITEDGHFLAYKGVRADFKDKYTGTVDNSPGATPSMPRNNVDDNRNRTCSKGYHVGTLEYARWYCGEQLMLVKVNPANIVSIPTDHEAQKCRVSDYEVLSVYDDPNPIQKSVWIDPSGDLDDDFDYDNSYDNSYDDDIDDDYDDDADESVGGCSCGDPYCTY